MMKGKEIIQEFFNIELKDKKETLLVDKYDMNSLRVMIDKAIKDAYISGTHDCHISLHSAYETLIDKSLKRLK